MLARLLLIYAVVELLVTVGLAAAIGVGWTVLLLLGTFVLGLILGAPIKSCKGVIVFVKWIQNH